MRTLLVSATVVVVAAGAASLAFASGGAPPSDQTAPAANTVVAVGSATADVDRPARLTNARIATAVRQARAEAVPGAVAAARADAVRMAHAAGLTLGRTVGVGHYDPPYYGLDIGRFGADRWCGRASMRRGQPSRWRCFPPARQTAWVKITVEAR